MADRGDTHFHVPTLNVWFMLSSVFFLGTIVWTVIDDWNAEWKHYQRNFRKLDLAKTEAEYEALAAESAATQAELEAAVAAAESALEERRAEVRDAEEAAYEAKEDRFAVEESFKKAKSVLNWEIFLAEKKLLEGGFESNEEMEASLLDYRESVVALEKEFQDADATFATKQEALEAVTKVLFDAEAALAKASADLDRLEKKIELLDPSDVAAKAANVVRDFPGLDFIGPNLQVQKYVLGDLTFDLNFTKKTRIDMCTTCHMGMENASWTEEELEPYLDDLGLEHAQPYSAHPRLDLYLTSKSPHPAKDFGCTICHRGSGESLSFQHVDHRPSDEEEKARWKEEYHWHKQKYWDYPMLRSKNVEASCVQCHKDSMELIADDAPTVSEGYRLFETKGCYACHKVEWFPVDRRPGPPLTNLASKLEEGFVDAWIAYPRDFRPETHMPQVFHLSNYLPEEVVTRSNYDTGEREILGQEWNDNAVAAVTAYLFDNHPAEPLPPIPGDLEADPDRGREVINVKGCFACHNTSPWDADSYDGVPALSNRITAHNEMGPNLRGVATKVNLTWLYNWLLDPQAYWPETRMPSMGLTPQDALDVATYIMEDPDGIFMDTPPGWSATADYTSVFDRDVLEEQARTFYQKLGRNALEAKLDSGDWADDRALAAAVGEAFVKNQGCFSCHEIDGLQTMMPIGAELTNWGSKTPDKLDFGLAYLRELELERDGVTTMLPKLDKYYREGWLERKLHHPRSFDIDKVKQPKDRLRMPWFDFSEEEVTAISTFMFGLVDDEVEDAKMVSTPQELAMDAGKRAVRQNNCMACHVVEPGTVTFEDEDGHDVTVHGEIQALFTGDDDPTFPPDPGVYLKIPPTMDSLAAFHAEREAAEEWVRYVNDDEDVAVEEVYVSLLGVNPDAGQEVGLPGEKVEVPLDKLVDVQPSLGGSFVRHVVEYYAYGTFIENPDYDPDDEESARFWRWTGGYDADAGLNLVEDVDGEMRPYGTEQVEKVRWTFAPPLLVDEGHKVQADWFYSFLDDPQPLRKQIRVKMPKFRYDEGEAEAIANYFAVKAANEWPARFSRTLRLVLGRDVKEDLVSSESTHSWRLPEQALVWPTAGLLTTGDGMSVQDLADRMATDEENQLTAATIEAIERGAQVDTEASFPKLNAWASSLGFTMVGPPKWGHEKIERRSYSHLEERQPFLEVGHAVAIEGVNCYQCHPNGDVYPETPVAWAPPLENVRSRLREDWVYEWLWAPLYIYPGTAMLTNFAADDPQYQDQYPDSTNQQQIQAVMDWLYNMDRPRSK